METALISLICLVLAAGGIWSVKYFGKGSAVETVAESVIAAETGTAPNLDADAAALGIKGPTGK